MCHLLRSNRTPDFACCTPAISENITNITPAGTSRLTDRNARHLARLTSLCITTGVTACIYQLYFLVLVRLHPVVRLARDVTSLACTFRLATGILVGNQHLSLKSKKYALKTSKVIANFNFYLMSRCLLLYYTLLTLVYTTISIVMITSFFLFMYVLFAFPETGLCVLLVGTLEWSFIIFLLCVVFQYLSYHLFLPFSKKPSYLEYFCCYVWCYNNRTACVPNPEIMH